MSFKESIQDKQEASKCKECLLFYASPAYQGLCSSCYKNNRSVKKQQKAEQLPSNSSTPLTKAEKEIYEEMEQLPLQPKKEQKDRKRCFACNKKVGLLGIECKCGFIYCNGHRLPQNHECLFNHKQKAKEKLRGEIVKVTKGKISDI